MHTHAMAAIGIVEIVNHIIKDGLHICGVDIRPGKLRQEPLQCLQCQQWGHFTINCLESQDACSTCRGNHCTTCYNASRRALESQRTKGTAEEEIRLY